MSSLLEQAIIDAKLLRETAQKNAEAAILDQYHDRIKNSIENLLEQDDAGLDLGGGDLGGGADTPPVEPEIPQSNAGKPTPQVKKVLDKIPPAYLGEDNLQEVEINLDSILEKVSNMEKELNFKIPDTSTPAHDVVPHGNPTRLPVDTLAEGEDDSDDGDEGGDLDENEDLEEETLDEELVIDLSNVSPGGINANEIELKKQHDIAKALEVQNTELNEELKQKYEELDEMEVRLQSALTRLQNTRKKLDETHGKLEKTTELNSTLRESLDLLAKKVKEVNLLNGRLLYTNKTLGNVSLNERQKKQIAESISKAKSVEEAKTIYETLQRTAEVNVERRSAPQSLTEAVNKQVPAFLPRNQSMIDPYTDRMQKLAGIKK